MLSNFLKVILDEIFVDESSVERGVRASLAIKSEHSDAQVTELANGNFLVV